jgi:YgiT-type zinc finger domain-containing protein
MKCFICNHAETGTGRISVQLERGQVRLTINNVPARICPNCGETYAVESVAANLLRQAERLARAGTKVEACEYAQGEDVYHEPDE